MRLQEKITAVVRGTAPILLTFLSAFLSVFLSAAEIPVDYTYADGRTETVTVSTQFSENTETLTIPQASIPAGVKWIDIHHPLSEAAAGEEGFFVLCNGGLGEFPVRENPEKSAVYTLDQTIMPIYGVRTAKGAFLAVLTGMRYEAQYRVEYKEGQYRVFPRWRLEPEGPYADISIEFRHLAPAAGYPDMARCYREYQLTRGEVRPLSERAAERPVLDYAARAPEVRVRMAWKPVPSPVGEQTAENEPPVHVAVTFQRMADIIEAFHQRGIKNAEFCLVGWNVGGHDGRYPQIFPVEEKLGTEAELKQVIRKAQEYGYQIVCHTNNSDAYHASEIGGLWDEGYLRRDREGKTLTQTTWGGGNMYETCPKPMYERFVPGDLARIKTLGFSGLHYIDVYSTVNPRDCHNPDHPLNKEEFAEWTNRIFKEAQDQIGGLASEGGFDYCARYLDFALYLSFTDPEKQPPELINRWVPIWPLVYHGIILSNPYSVTVNPALKGRKAELKLIEYGGRPAFYYYSKFKSDGSNWMGDEDLTCADDAQLAESVEKVAESVQEYDLLSDLQFRYMENHEKIADGIFRTEYSGGTSVYINYRDTPYEQDGRILPPLGYLRIDSDGSAPE